MKIGLLFPKTWGLGGAFGGLVTQNMETMGVTFRALLSSQRITFYS
jgi:hypothetical protein